ncbi:MAG: ABC transporter substrate-binding protein [Planctomycetota bacterium]
MILNAAPAKPQRLWRDVCLVLGLFVASSAGHAQPAPTSGEPPAIVLGMSTVLTGPAAALGINMRGGVDLAIAEHNKKRAAGTPQIKLTCLDDGYEPARTAPNMRELITKHHVLAVVGNVGTPTGVVAAPIAVAAKTPFIGAFTGAALLRATPPERYIFNVRASYHEEIEAMVATLIDKWKIQPGEIAFFTQRDAYGDAGWSGGVKALAAHGLKSTTGTLHVRYERNTLDVEGCVADLLGATTPPKAVIMVGAYAPSARFIRLCHQSKLNPLFLNVSFVGAESLASELGSDGDGVIVTQVVPPLDADLPAVKEFAAALATLPEGERPKASLGMLEGYLVGRITCEAIARCSGTPTPEQLTDALESLGEFDAGLGGKLRLSKDEHQASHVVWPSIIESGKVLSRSWESMVKPGGGGEPK